MISRIDYDPSVIWFSPKNSTCPLGKLRTKITSPIAKSTSHRLSDKIFSAHCNTIVCFLHFSVRCIAELWIFLCIMLWESLGCGFLKEQHQNFDQTCQVSLLFHDSQNFSTYLMLSWIVKWFLTLSGKVKLQKHFWAVGLFFLDVNR